MNLIVDHLTAHGVMEAAMWYESPFTDLTPRGPEALSSSAQVDELVRVLDTGAFHGDRGVTVGNVCP